ncbi:hypothetical protein Tamer19_07500 [Cupriavidus sp. TA19]|nr:hypothetical protein Tamer19_07500 [Cupriavidus sp. TA19]
MFSLSPHGEKVGERGGLARHHIKQGPRFNPQASAFDPPALSPNPFPASGRGEQTSGNFKPSQPLEPSKIAGLHLEHHSDSRTPLPAAYPDLRIVRRRHFDFPFEFNELHSADGPSRLARRVQYRPPLTAPRQVGRHASQRAGLAKKQRRKHMTDPALPIPPLAARATRWHLLPR